MLKPTPTDILPPHNEDAERATLGSLMIDPDALAKISSFLEARHFYETKHGWIYDAIRACGEHADLLTVGAELARNGLLDECGGESYLTSLMGDVPTALNVTGYARIVEEYAVRRSYIQASQAILRMAYDQGLPLNDVITGAMKQLDAAHKPHTRNASLSAREVFEAFAIAVENRHDNPLVAAGTPTGFGDIDKMLGGGYHKGELIIIASRPGMGKTSLLNCIAANATGLNRYYKPARHYTIGFYSMEMIAEELANRFAAADIGVDSQRIRMGDLRDDEWGPFTDSIMRHSDAPLYINEHPQSVTSMVEDAERIMLRSGLDLIMCDYLALFEEHGDSYERTSKIARDLKNAAKYLKLPIIAAAQLSRSCEGRENKRPILSDLRDSGEIEQAADVVQFIYRDEYYNADTEFKNMAEINTAKNRNGPTGTATLYFDKSLTKFANLSRERIQL